MSQSVIGLVNPKNPVNVGAIIRNAGCFGVEEVYFSGRRYARAATYNKGHSRLSHGDTQKASDRVALIHTDSLVDVIEKGMRFVCVELVEGAQPLVNYTHAEQAFYLFGPEDGSIPQALIDKADDVVYIPTTGCLNLATSVALTLYDRLAKRGFPHDADQLIRQSRDNNNRLHVKR